MNSLIYQEITQRGTSDFPIEYYVLDRKHPRYVMQLHWHKDIELIRVTKGKLECTIGDVPFTLESGDSMYIPSGIPHGAIPYDCEYECVVFPPSILYATQRIRSAVKSQILLPVKFSEIPEIRDIFDGLRTQEEGYEFDVASSLYRLASLALRNQSEIASPVIGKADRIKPALYYIRKNFNEKISLETLASECEMSPNYFCKLFREATGETPVEYITTYRLEMASEMLRSGAKVTDVAFECGFNDLSYFIHIFKKNLGISPKQYAKGE